MKSILLYVEDTMAPGKVWCWKHSSSKWKCLSIKHSDKNVYAFEHIAVDQPFSHKVTDYGYKDHYIGKVTYF